MDILCIAHCTPHLLATGSYDGEIIVWNVVSERILSRFQTPQPTPQQSSYPGTVCQSSHEFSVNNDFRFAGPQSNLLYENLVYYAQLIWTTFY